MTAVFTLLYETSQSNQDCRCRRKRNSGPRVYGQMKRLKPVKVKTIVVGRNGRSVKNTTLSLHPIGSGQPVEASAADKQETAASLTDEHDAETGLLSPTDERPPTLGRMISSAVNWDRVRHDLLNASTEEEASR